MKKCDYCEKEKEKVSPMLSNGYCICSDCSEEPIETLGTMEQKHEQERKQKKQFEITSVNREDLQSIGFDTSTLTDENMEDIAHRLAESYMNGNASFLQDLESIAIEVYKLKQHEM